MRRKKMKTDSTFYSICFQISAFLKYKVGVTLVTKYKCFAVKMKLVNKWLKCNTRSFLLWLSLKNGHGFPGSARALYDLVAVV